MVSQMTIPEHYRMDDLLEKHFRINRVRFRPILRGGEPLDYEMAERIVEVAETLTPMDVKPEMYRPLLHFKDALPYEVAAERVAAERLKD